MAVGKRSARDGRNAFDANRFAEVEQVKGAFMFIPATVIEKVGMWDERFFLWFEDTDLCARVRAAGYRIYYTPEAEVVHRKEGSIRQLSFWRRYCIWEQSLFRYFYKHHGIAAALAVTAADPFCMLAGVIGRRLRARSATL
jgi:hypothetical protein